MSHSPKMYKYFKLAFFRFNSVIKYFKFKIPKKGHRLTRSAVAANDARIPDDVERCLGVLLPSHTVGKGVGGCDVQGVGGSVATTSGRENKRGSGWSRHG